MRPYISKTREGAKVVSREAVYLQFDQSNMNQTMVGSVRAFGGPSVDAYTAGMTLPNVQDAIGELATAAVTPVGGIVIMSENISPQGQPQQDEITISGTASVQGEPSAIIHIFGLPFIITEGMSADALCTKLVEKLEELKTQNVVFKTVQRRAGSADIIVDVSYLDTSDHNENITPDSTFGFTISRQITSPAKPGYGSWSYMGYETKTLSGILNASPTDLHYFKRIA